MDGVSRSGPPRKRINVYAGAILLGAILIIVGIVGGAVTKDLSVAGTVATTVPGIALFLFGIRAYGGDEA